MPQIIYYCYYFKVAGRQKHIAKVPYNINIKVLSILHINKFADNSELSEKYVIH